MDKVQMKKLGINSPNKADAISMTFLRPDGAKRSIWGVNHEDASLRKEFDPSSPLGDI